MIEHWFLLAIGSTLFNGLRSFFTKVAVEGGMLSAAGRLLPPTVMVMLALPMIWLNDDPLATAFGLMVFAAVLQGGLFYVGTMCRFEALRLKTPTHVLFPITQGSTPLIIILSGILFDEWSVVRQPAVCAGILASLAATYVLAEWRNVDVTFRRGVGLATVAMLASAGATLAAKYAFEKNARINVFGFIAVSNLTGVALAGLQSAGETSASFRKTDWLWGLALGALNFLGLTLFLEAIQWGELSLIASVSALSLLVPIVLGAVIHQERLTPKQQLAVCLSFLGLLLFAKA